MDKILGCALLRLSNETNWNTYQYSTVHKTVYEYEYLPPQMVSRGSIKRLTGNTIYGYTAKWHNRPCHVTNEAKKAIVHHRTRNLRYGEKSFSKVHQGMGSAPA